MTLYEPHVWEDGSTGERLTTWAAAVNTALLSLFCWAGIAALVRLVVG